VRLYEKEEATVRIAIKGHVEKAKASTPDQQPKRRRHEEPAVSEQAAPAPAADSAETKE
jgi:hypothetical protein